MTAPPTLGLVLAGGLARRMGGGDKARIKIGGVSILQRVLACLTPQCSRVIINANGDPARFADTGLPVVADSVPDFAGPLPAFSPVSIGRRIMRRTTNGSSACRAIVRSCRRIW